MSFLPLFAIGFVCGSVTLAAIQKGRSQSKRWRPLPKRCTVYRRNRRGRLRITRKWVRMKL